MNPQRRNVNRCVMTLKGQQRLRHSDNYARTGIRWQNKSVKFISEVELVFGLCKCIVRLWQENGLKSHICWIETSLSILLELTITLLFNITVLNIYIQSMFEYEPYLWSLEGHKSLIRITSLCTPVILCRILMSCLKC